MEKDTQKQPLKWWLMLLISILSAIAGSLGENATGFIGSLI